MDAYSEIIINSLDKVKNSVVRIDIYHKKQGRILFAGTGSGFIFSSDGLIFTNDHVISNAAEIKVTLLDGSEFEAEIVGCDTDSDIGIIKIYGSGYSVAQLGNSFDLKIGQLLIAVGNPLGYHHSVSAGILSGMERTMRARNGQLIDNILQSDVSLNPGNSGGPMINTEGHVIGINTAVIAGAQGISFSIAIDMAKDIAEQLIQFGKVTRAYLGLMIQDIEIHPRLRNFYKLPQSRGALVIGIEESSPAKRALLQEGDIIIEFDNNILKSSNDLTKQLQRKIIFTPTPLKVIRKGVLLEKSIFPVERIAA
jgi:S1-C subfamily serine protease